MKTIKILFILILLTATNTASAQFLKKLGKKVKNATERTIERKVERKTEEKTSEVMDTILNSNKKEKRKKKRKNRKRNNSSSNKNSTENNTTSNRNINSKQDFVSGSEAIYTDTFKNDAIGDFPVTWNTNSSGEIITFNNSNTKWLQLDLGAFTPDGVTEIPENCTIEFDLTVSDNFNSYSDGITLNIFEAKNKNKDFMQWSRFKAGKNGVRLRLKPKNFEKTGETAIQTYVDNQKILDNKKNTDQFNLKNNIITHVALWRQKNRLRVYLNGQKVWDIPRAFSSANYNAISFYTSGKNDEHFYITNLRIAKAGKDLRKALLENGKFITNDINFDVNKAIIKPNSYKTLNKIGELLSENPDLAIKIIGHTDSDGSTQANQKLSEKRAEAIKDYLIKNFSIDASRLETIGKGESEPIESNATPEGKAKNRRVEFVKI